MRFLLSLSFLLASCLAGRQSFEPGKHHLLVFERPSATESPIARVPEVCTELIPSWNVRIAPGQPVLFDVAVGDGAGDWSAWMFVGSWGSADETGDQRTECAWGRVDVDTFVAARPFDRAKLRLRTVDGAAFAGEWARAAFCFSREPLQGKARDRFTGPAVELAVPYRSQRWESDELASRVCSPTSVAMVLEHYGLPLATATVAARAYDANYDIYGNWSRAVQCAFSYGFPGYVTRFSDWESVEAFLSAGTPLIASVRVEEGELTGGPFESSDGHLLVLRGIDRDGRILVNDPAFPDAEQGRTSYSREELERVWFERRKGTAYVIERR